MKLIYLVLLFSSAAYAASFIGPKAAPPCDTGSCQLPNCRCSTTGSVPGGLSPGEVPQIVLLTFDDAVNQLQYDAYYTVALDGRQNPNGCPIAATFFASHEYSDYTLVNALYNKGHEIAIHSLTHTTNTQYWENADKQTLSDEFAGERQTISHFANIPSEDVKGVRTPFLVLAGDTTFEVMNENGFYDCSWPTQTHVGQGLYPYTLDYATIQDCRVGLCPVESHPGTWVVPMVDWIGVNGQPCAMVDACNIENIVGEEPLLEFMKGNFHRHYDGLREPFGFYVHAAWFQANDTNFQAYQSFIDYMQTKSDVYIVNVAQAIKWTSNPTPTSGAGSIFDCPARSAGCDKTMCVLDKPNEGQRYMNQCQPDCPPNYPWLGNPLGQ